MATLMIMRHAKSSWDDPGLSDRDRPLNYRGRGDAPLLAEWLIRCGLLPDAVMMSHATRAIETWETMAPLLPDTRAEVRPEIYHAGTDAMTSLLRNVDPGTERLLMIGHEPGVSYTTNLLARDPVPSECQIAFEKFPTASIAVLETGDVPWHRLSRGCARLLKACWSMTEDLAEEQLCSV